MKTYMTISMYPEYAFIHIHVVNSTGYNFSTCEQIDKEKALELAWQFNIQIT